MGKASISIAITSNYNSRGIDKARADMERLAVQAVSMHGTIGNAAVDAGAMLGQFGARMETVGKQIASLGDKLTLGITLPVGIAATATTLAATKIDTAWYNVRKTVDMTEEGYRRLKEGAIALSDIQPVSAETLLNIESLGGQLGISTDYLEEFARVVSGLDIATNLDADTAATELAQFRNIVRMSEDDLDNWASTVVDLGNHTATTEADLVNLAMRFASAAHIAGMSNAEILGLSAALSGLGMKAEAGGSAISRTVNDINTSVSVGGDKLKKWADLVKKTPEEFAAAWRGNPTQEFLEVLQNIGNAGEDMGKVLDDLGITQIRQSDAMRRLASSGEYVNEVVERANSAWSQNSALTREVENRNESLAAKFETVWNRIVNTAAIIGDPIADGILNALDAIEPLFNSLRDGAEAFANLNPVTQDFIFKLTGIAVAAGPVLSIMGRLISIGGSYFKTVGRITQQFGVFTEALHTNDTAMLRSLSTNDSFAARVGASHNSIVKAAGGLKEFNVKLHYASESVRKMGEAQERSNIYANAYAKAQQEGVTSTTELNKAASAATQTQKAKRKITEAGTKAVNNMSSAEVLNTKVTREQRQEYEKMQGTLDAGITKVTVFKAALAGIGVMAGITLLTAAFTYFAAEAEHARERAEKLQQATKGLEDASRTTSIYMDSQSSSEDALATSHGNLAAEADKLIEKQAQLAEDISETNRAANVQVGDLNRAWKVIDAYANQTGLSADKQFQLKEAIETVNELGGTQYEVVDAVNGKIADESGAIQENTDALRDNIDAIKQQVKMKAIQSNLEGIWAQQSENTRLMAQEYAQHGDLIEQDRETRRKMDEIIAQSNKAAEAGDLDRVRELNIQYGELNGKLHDVTADYFALEKGNESLVKSESNQTRALELMGQETRSLANDLEIAFESSGRSAYFEEFGKNAEQFAASCQEMGLGVEDFENMSEEVFGRLVKNYQGTAASIRSELQKSVEGMTLLFENASNIGGVWDNAKHSVGEFAEACMSAGINFESMNALGSENMHKLSQEFDGSVRSIIKSLSGMGSEGKSIIDNLVGNWSSGFSGATTSLASSVATLRGTTVGELMAICEDFGLVGEDAVRAFLEGLQTAPLSTTPEEVAQQVAEKMKQPDKFRESADANFTSYDEEFKSKTPVAQSSGEQVGSAAAQGEKSTSGQHQTSGNVTGDSYARGVLDYEPAAHTSGYTIGSSAADGESSTSDQHDTAGKTTGQSYADGLSSKSDAAYNAGYGVASSSVSGLQQFDNEAYNWGLHLGSNFAAGLRKSNGIITTAATAAAFSAAHLLRHSTPEAGPLKDDDVWGYHFAQNLAEGMRKGTPLINRQANAIASAMTIDGRAVAATSRAAIRRYGVVQSGAQTYSTRGEVASQTVSQAAQTPSLTREDVRAAVAEAISEAVPPEFAMYINGSKLASSIAGDMDYQLGLLDARR